MITDKIIKIFTKLINLGIENDYNKYMPTQRYNIDNKKIYYDFLDNLDDMINDNKSEVILNRIPEDIIQNYLRVKKINRILKR